MVQSNPRYADIVNHLVTGKLPKDWNKHYRDRFLKFGEILHME